METISKEQLKEHHVCVQRDSKFMAYTRYLQALWRESKGYPIGEYKGVKYGNLIAADYAKIHGTNFLTSEIFELVKTEMQANKLQGNPRLISEPRIWNNLLSSQPLCFNLFGQLLLDLELATRYFAKLYPDRIATVTDIKMEYSPGRGNEAYLGDRTAFDIFVQYTSLNGNSGFIGIEVKYAENLADSSSKTLKTFDSHKRYAEVSDRSGLFKCNSLEKLKRPPIFQIWRDHLLALSMLQKDKDKYDEGFYVFLYPSENTQCAAGIEQYFNCLNSKDNNVNACIYTLHLEDAVDVLLQASDDAKWARELKSRYLGD